MRKALLLALSAMLVAGAFVAGAWFGQTRPILRPAEPAPLSTTEARELSDTELRERILDLLADQVVDVSDVAPADLPQNFAEGLDQVSLSLAPRPAGPGLCSARVLAVEFETGNGQFPETADDRVTVSDIRTRRAYKIIGPADLNGDAPTQEQCQGQPFTDGYFLADESADASAAARFIEAMQAAAGYAGPLPFKISCGPQALCEPIHTTLSSLTADKLVMVSGAVDECPSGRTCAELVFETGKPVQTWHPPTMTGVKIVGRYEGVGAKGWGILRIEAVTLG